MPHPSVAPWRSERGTRQRALRNVLLLGVAAALARASCFVRLPAGANAPGRSELRRRAALRATPAGADGDVEDAPGYSYTPFNWMIDFSIPDDQLEAVIAKVPNIDTVWPDSSKALTRRGFREFIKRGGVSYDERAIDSIFNAMDGSSGIIVNNFRDKVAEAISSWRTSDGVVDVDAAKFGMVGARLQILGAWLFLNVFSVYAGYFVIGRPILYQLTGIDLLPGLKKFWEG